ncbi:MAG: glycosyltransferase family 8 protein [Clostridia bacterium]|nr:glycosyltransferase family 8 protein [Clostridia bacterium]
MNNNKTVPVFFAVDDNYVPFLLVTLESITSNASKDNQYIFHVLNNGISESNIERLNQYNHDNFKVELVNVAKAMQKIGDALHTRDYYSKTTYYRLFIPNMFPQFDKALYLDCDIAVQGDVAELYSYELGSNYVGAIADESVSIVPEFSAYTKNFLGVDGNRYFNAGILVMNLKRLREIHFESKFVNLISSYTFYVAQDQDYLNVICKDRVTYIPKIWNKMPFEDKNMNLADIKLIHYNLSYKPWHYDNIIYQEVFWKYAKQAGCEQLMQQLLADFTDDKKQKDAMGGKKLIETAYELSIQKDPFKSLLESGEINPDTYLRRDALDPDKVFSEFVEKLGAEISKKFNKN